MSKLLSALIVGVFAAGTAFAADAPKPVELKPAPALEAPKADAGAGKDEAKPAKKTKKAKKSRKAKKAH